MHIDEGSRTPTARSKDGDNAGNEEWIIYLKLKTPLAWGLEFATPCLLEVRSDDEWGFLWDDA